MEKTINIDLGLLPYWNGVQASPVHKTSPFIFEIDKLGLIRLKSSEIISEVVNAYGEDNYHFPTSPPGSSEWGNTLAQKSIDGLVKVFPDIQGLDVMEVGAGTTYCARYMLDELNAKSVTIVDPSITSEKSDADIILRREYFSEGTSVDKLHKLFVAFNTLEHIPDPVDFLRGAHKHLTDDGMIFIKVPDCEYSFLSGDLGLCTHEHLSYFTLESLDVILQHTGFERVAESNYLGVLQILAKKKKSNTDVYSDNSSHLLNKFSAKVISNIERFKKFAEKHTNEKVAFIGASVGLSNFIYTTKITDYLDVSIYDSDSLKTGKYIPGLKTSIQKTDNPTIKLQSHIFITPINFYDEIRIQLDKNLNLFKVNVEPVFQ